MNPAAPEPNAPAASASGPTDPGPVTRMRFETSDVGEAIELMEAQYARVEPSYPRGRSRFRFSVASEALAPPGGRLRIDRTRHSIAMRTEAEPVGEIYVVSTLSGRIRWTWRRRQVRAMALIPFPDRFDLEWDEIDMLITSVDLAALQRVGAEMAGIEPAAVAFRDMAALSPARARALATLILHTKRDLLPDDELMASPLARAETFRHLATTLLMTFPNTALDAVSDPEAPGPGSGEPATVRRAVAFIDAHAGEPIGIAEIAAAAGLGARGLQHAFARHRDTTPLGHLRRVRLERARRDLVGADPTAGDTVARIAARWGFTHPSRFTAAYRQCFGETPSTTLRR